MRWHVHVYAIAGKGEVDLLADDEQQAMARALARAKAGTVPVDQEPETRFMALVFPADGSDDRA